MYAVKVWRWKDKKAGTKTDTRTFETVNEFNKWSNGEELKKYEVKYYKGLGTYLSTDAEDDFKKGTLELLI